MTTAFRQVAAIFLASMLGLTPVAVGDDNLSPLAEALRRLFLDSSHTISAPNPLETTEEFWRGAYTPAEWKSAWAELQHAYPEEVLDRLNAGEKFREAVLASISNSAVEAWKKVPPSHQFLDELINSWKLFELSQKSVGMRKRTTIELHVDSRNIFFSKPGNHQLQWLSESKWSWNQRHELHKIVQKLEDEPVPKKDGSTAAEEAVKFWKQQALEKLNTVLQMQAREYLGLVVRELPGNGFVFFHPNSLLNPKLGNVLDPDLKINLETGDISYRGMPFSRSRGLWYEFKSLYELNRRGLDQPLTIAGQTEQVERDFDRTFAVLDMHQKWLEQSRALLTAVERMDPKEPLSSLGAYLEYQVRHFERDPLHLAEHSSLHKRVPAGPLSEPFTQLAWARIAENPSVWQEFGERTLIPYRSLSEVISNKKVRPGVRVRGLAKGFSRAGLLWGAILLAHIGDDIARSPEARRAWDATVSATQAVGAWIDKHAEAFRESDFGKWTAERAGAVRDFVSQYLPSRERAEQQRQAQEEKVREREREQNPLYPKSTEGISQEALEKVPPKSVIADADKPELPHNKGEKGEGRAESQKAVFEITLFDDPLDKVPTSFWQGYTTGLQQKDRVEVPNPRPGPTGFSLRTADGKFHVARDGILILPRAEGNIPLAVSLMSEGGYVYPKVYLTANGVVYAELPKGWRDGGIRMRVGYTESRVVERELESPVFNNLDLDAVSRENQKLRELGATVLADLLDERVEFSRKGGVALSVRDLAAPFRAGSYYSFQRAALDVSKAEDDYERFLPFLYNGRFAFQCDGARALAKTYFMRLFRSNPEVDLEDGRLIVRASGKTTLTEDDFHAELRLRLRSSRQHVKIDFTPSEEDPRDLENRSKKDKVPSFLVERAPEKPLSDKNAMEGDEPKLSDPQVTEAPKVEERPPSNDKVAENDPPKTESPSESDVPSSEKSSEPKELPKRQARVEEVPWYHRWGSARSLFENTFGPRPPGTEGGDSLVEDGLWTERQRRRWETGNEVKRRLRRWQRAKRNARSKSPELPKELPIELPLAPPEVVAIRDAVERLLEVIGEKEKAAEHHDVQLPEVVAYRLGRQTQHVVETGQGLSELRKTLEEILAKSVSGEASTVVDQLVSLGQDKEAERMRHAAQVLARKTRANVHTHDPTIVAATASVYKAVADYPWAKDIEINAESTDCGDRTKRLAMPRYRMPARGKQP